jgi:hypothetical protein
MASVGLALWPVNGFLALSASLGVYALGLVVLGAFTPDEIALILGRRAHGDMRKHPDPAGAQ